MPESTLALSITELRSEVGQYLGYGRTYSSMTTDQKAQVDATINAGLRQFYYPTLVQGQSVAHKWSFLALELSLALRSSVAEYDLPDDLGGLEGDLGFQPVDSCYYTIRRVNIGELRADQQRTYGLTGKPSKVAVLPKREDGALGQRFIAVFWPTPDATYTIRGPYNPLPAALTDQAPFPYGGMAHAETILESCLAVAESRLNDEITTHRQEFERRLAASIAVDTQNRPEFLGYNGDTSDQRGRWPLSRHDQNYTVTVNGVSY